MRLSYLCTMARLPQLMRTNRKRRSSNSTILDNWLPLLLLLLLLLLVLAVRQFA